MELNGFLLHLYWKSDRSSGLSLQHNLFSSFSQRQPRSWHGSDTIAPPLIRHADLILSKPLADDSICAVHIGEHIGEHTALSKRCLQVQNTLWIKLIPSEGLKCYCCQSDTATLLFTSVSGTNLKYSRNIKVGELSWMTIQK